MFSLTLFVPPQIFWLLKIIPFSLKAFRNSNAMNSCQWFFFLPSLKICFPYISALGLKKQLYLIGLCFCLYVRTAFWKMILILLCKSAQSWKSHKVHKTESTQGPGSTCVWLLPTVGGRGQGTSTLKIKVSIFFSMLLLSFISNT